MGGIPRTSTTARIASKTPGERLPGEEDQPKVQWTYGLTNTGWRFGGRVLRSFGAMTWLA
jgi:hypothetical protein